MWLSFRGSMAAGGKGGALFRTVEILVQTVLTVISSQKGLSSAGNSPDTRIMHVGELDRSTTRATLLDGHHLRRER